MIIKRMQTILNIFTESGELESSSITEQYTIEPEKGKLLQNIKTGAITACLVCVNKREKVNNYTEIEDPSAR
jgi:hypothetical protein